MQPKASVPPSRQGKKQMITYVDADLARAVEKKAASENKTMQELLAEAANSVLAAHDRAPILKPKHQRVLRRKRGRSRPRTNANAPECRTGKRPIGGWYEIKEVQDLAAFARELGLGRERMLEIGLRHITGLQLMKGLDLKNLEDLTVD
jgi:hypothetical protein